ncbi:hypothetical protein DW020_15205 [Clostridium sp. AF37-5AT]|nr:hypothetical protein DW020_15205 [Clostridium sp. AF37-5AT]
MFSYPAAWSCRYGIPLFRHLLTSGKKAASDLILQLEADRVHTLIPGLLVLQHVFHLFQAQQLIVSKYGVREGYLCERVLKKCH